MKCFFKFKTTYFLHAIIWMLYIMSPLIFFKGNDNIDTIHFVRHIVIALSLMFLFYLNYAYLVKRYLATNKLRTFALYNFLAIGLCCCINYVTHEVTEPYIVQAHTERMKADQLEWEKLKKQGITIKEHKHPKRHEKKAMTFVDTLLNIFAFVSIVGTAIAIHSIQNIALTEKKKKEEENAKVEAELKNLKSQLNPHFLFNTLNNIYALIAISQDKSQEAVMDLSKMLRYVLYEAEAKEVPIAKEINFIENYVKLMRLRLSNKVEVNVMTDITKSPNLNIAPLLFITLIENAFKHGISSQENSFIHFSIIATDEHTIKCELTNSYFPKTEEHDKSGSGIGLENLKRRLELIYPKCHTFTYGVSNAIYTSELIIKC